MPRAGFHWRCEQCAIDCIDFPGLSPEARRCRRIHFILRFTTSIRSLPESATTAAPSTNPRASAARSSGNAATTPAARALVFFANPASEGVADLGDRDQGATARHHRIAIPVLHLADALAETRSVRPCSRCWTLMIYIAARPAGYPRGDANAGGVFFSGGAHARARRCGWPASSQFLIIESMKMHADAVAITGVPCVRSLAAQRTAPAPPSLISAAFDPSGDGGRRRTTMLPGTAAGWGETCAIALR